MVAAHLRDGVARRMLEQSGDDLPRLIRAAEGRRIVAEVRLAAANAEAAGWKALAEEWAFVAGLHEHDARMARGELEGVAAACV